MPACGGFAPYPRRMGGGKPVLQSILEALNAGRGSGVDVTDTSPIYAENMAYARMLASVWSMNERLSHQWDPLRMTDCLARWEAICGVSPSPGDTLTARRARISQIFARIGLLINRPALVGMLRAAVGPILFDVEYTSTAKAVIHTPSSYGTGTVSALAPWMSTVLHVTVRLQVPAGYTDAHLYEAAGKVTSILDEVLPAWCTFDWYRAPVSTPIAVVGGPSAGGFYLDDPHNLDNNVFDV